MKQVIVLGLIASLGLAGCGGKKQQDLCDRVLAHWSSISAPPEDAKPSAGEQAIIDLATKMALGECRKEGLSQAQADCILQARTLEEGMRLIRCPAIAAKKPSWLQVPSEEALDALEAARRDDTAPPPAVEDAGAAQDAGADAAPTSPGR